MKHSKISFYGIKLTSTKEILHILCLKASILCIHFSWKITLRTEHIHVSVPACLFPNPFIYIYRKREEKEKGEKEGENEDRWNNRLKC